MGRAAYASPVARLVAHASADRLPITSSPAQAWGIGQFSDISQAYILRLEAKERSNPSKDLVLKLGLALIKGSEALEIWDVDVLLLSAGYAELRGRGDLGPVAA